MENINERIANMTEKQNSDFFEKNLNTSDDITEGTVNLFMTAAERAKITNSFDKTVDDSDDITEGATNLYMTTAERAQIVTNTSNIATNTSDIASKANDNEVVHLTGNETISGLKTFNTLPRQAVYSVPANDTDFATKKYVVDSLVAGGFGDMLAAVYDPTNQATDAFSMDNMIETATKKILTSAERDNIALNYNSTRNLIKEVAWLKLQQEAASRIDGTNLTLFGTNFTADLELTNNTVSATTTEAVTTSDNQVDVSNNGAFNQYDEVTIDDGTNSESNVIASKTINIYDIANASYASKLFDPSAQVTITQDIAFNNDTTSMYLATGGAVVYQYTLSAAGDVSTASYASKSFDFTAQTSTVQGIDFNTDGTKVYIGGASAIFQYSLSTAFDISTASYDSKTVDVSAQSTFTRALRIKNSGTKMYFADATADAVFQYTLSTPYDVSTATYDSKSLSVNAQESTPLGFDISEDGTKLVVVGNNSNTAYLYNISTPFDLSTGSYSGNSLLLTSEQTNNAAVVFDDTETKFYTGGNVPNRIHQYNAGSVTLGFVSNFSNSYAIGTNIYRSVDETIAANDTENMRLDIDTLNDHDTISVFITVDSEINVTASASIVGDTSNESYTSLTQDSVTTLSDGTKEYLFIGSVATPNSKVAVKFNLVNTAGTTKSIYKIIGGAE